MVASRRGIIISSRYEDLGCISICRGSGRCLGGDVAAEVEDDISQIVDFLEVHVEPLVQRLIRPIGYWSSVIRVRSRSSALAISCDL